MKKLLILLVIVFISISVCGFAEDNFELEMVQTASNDWGAIRYDVVTGKSWFVERGNWVQFQENANPPNSSYKVKMISLDNGWSAIRYDVKTGASWRAKSGAWVKMTEQ